MNITPEERARRVAQSQRDKSRSNQNGKRKQSNRQKQINAARASVPRPMAPRPGRKILRLPKNVIDSKGLENVRQRDVGNLASRYLRCLVNNHDFESRYPDSNPRKTAVFTSVSSLDVPITMNAGGSEGRFSAAIQPIMGDVSDPTHYQTAIANVNTDDWNTTDWSLEDSYAENVAGKDPRVDINSSFLTSGAPVSNETDWETNTLTVAQIVTTAGVSSAQNVGPQVATLNASGLTSGQWNYKQGGIVLPKGTWMVVAAATFTTGAAAQNHYIYSNFDEPNFNLTNQGSATILENSRQVDSPGADANGANFSFWKVQVNSASAIFAPIMGTGVPAPMVANSYSLLEIDLYVTPLVDVTNTTGGAIQLIRPVAQTVLATYMGSSLNDGGQISAAFVQKGVLESNFFSAASMNSLGMYQNQENLANAEGAYNGPLKTGAYVWWSPNDPTDVSFGTIDKQNAQDWPSIIVSGTYDPGQNTGANAQTNNIVRLLVVSTFEMITTSTAFDQQVAMGSQSTIDEVNRLLGMQCHAMPNGKHLDWIKSMLGTLARGVIKYGPTAVKFAGAVAPFLI